MMSHIDQVSLISRKESFQMTMELESVKLQFLIFASYLKHISKIFSKDKLRIYT